MAERPAIVPDATYRLQLNAAFGFDDAAAIVPYLRRLGVSHVYASPVLMARPGSTHGYDVIDFNRINPELGGDAAFHRLVDTLHRHGMGLVVDFVPNHMGVGADNPWWLDVLEWGQESPFARFFDIDWDAHARGVRDKVVLPVLGDQYGRILEAGELQLAFEPETGTFHVAYYDNRFPVAVRDYAPLLRAAGMQLEGRDPLGPLADRFAGAAGGGSSLARRSVRRREASLLKTELVALATAPEVTAAIRSTLELMNGIPGEPASFRRLHRLLEGQAYRLAYWRVARSDINYRRFFDINELAGLRMERSEVFEATHGLLLRLIAEGAVQGVRLDHIDGLYDPAGYCERLLERVEATLAQAGATPPADRRAAGRPIWLLVEKILARHEYLREDLPVAGTTGYEFMNLVLGLFVNPSAEVPLTRFYARYTERPPDFAALVKAAKRQILRASLGSELSVVAHELYRLAQQSWRSRDFTLTGIREALADVIVGFPVYRTYITDSGPKSEDRRDLEWAISQARKETLIVDQTVFDFIYRALSTDLVQEAGYRRRDVILTAMHFQQLTGPVMAKSLEDTAFYRYLRLVALNEVGGEPDHFGVSPSAFHTLCQRELRHHPLTMVTTSTHDHKRGEDARIRIAALSELPQEWVRRVRRWTLLNRARRGTGGGAPAPSRNAEYLFYQSLIGVWPLEVRAPEDLAGGDLAERMVAYMIKASREAKEETAWTAQNPEYEAALEQFVRRVLDPERSRPFLADFIPFQERIALTGAVSGLAQTLLKLTAPGIPDLYQGSELFDLSLVDPDNRRPVDYGLRDRNLDAPGPDPAALVADWRSGRIKQHVVAAALRVRRARPDVFRQGAYLPLAVEGQHADRVVALARTGESGVVVVAVPRLVTPLLAESEVPLPAPERWGATRVVLPDEIAGRVLTDELTGRRHGDGNELRLADLLVDLPVALLAADPAVD
ncbi:MAG TPA: malto-oligosyltrehalose synthase [Geminicoccaceae bacterium]